MSVCLSVCLSGEEEQGKEEEKSENFLVLTNISQKQQQENVEKRRKNINFVLGRGYTYLT